MTPSPEWFEGSVRRLCYQVPVPVQRILDDAETYQFPEQTIQNAILLKTARFVSGLHAGNLLLKHGFVQELGTLQRTLDDFETDAMFLALACIYDDLTPLHQVYLDWFWAEDPSQRDFVLNQKKKPEPPRKKQILSYIARRTNGGIPDHTEIATGKYVLDFYSGYVHGAGPHLMDMYDPSTRRLSVAGTKFSPLLAAHQYDFENYVFRGVVLMAVAAEALGESNLHKEALSIHEELKPHFT